MASNPSFAFEHLNLPIYRKGTDDLKKEGLGISRESRMKFSFQEAQSRSSELKLPNEALVRRFRVVGFKKTVLVRIVESYLDMPTEEREHIWHSPRDYALFQDEARAVLDNYNKLRRDGKSKGENEVSVCIRGLERMTAEGSEACARHRDAVWSAVFKEQLQQDKKDVFDAQGIATQASSASHPAREEARNIAQEDESRVRLLF